MPIPDPPAYDHGSTGTQPPQPRDYNTGDPLDADELDYYLHTEFTTLDEIITALTELENGTIQVASADAADVAASANSVAGSDVDGQVNSAAEADQAKRFEVRTNDPSNPQDGQLWIRNDL